ncbi:MAG: alkaline phosphatase, partial [Candidatus Latescibacteria bacterium]|nr:alkaline phosphatase [Candidatus Latescibacterota bacterium]
LGRKPGDPQSTDPEGLIKQLYTQTEWSGGFLMVTVKPADSGQGIANAEFSFYDEHGALLYSVTKTAKK